MFSRILIANRGEIACRIMKTAKQMGIRTVAVYSDADRDALHVRTADEAVPIGASPVSESYLRGDSIIAAALMTGAEAIHPGYGFLSENADFADAVKAAGLAFIGPSAAAIRAMGRKDAAKTLMQKAGVPVVPGYHGERQDEAFLAEEAAKIGYPVLIKARAGGGGKGMRRVDQPADFKAALEGAAREAKSSFGDGHVLIEKYINQPRHIEVQVFGDSHGNVVHLYERDCSLQRRHQKVIEEAPAPGMTPSLRAAMTGAAVHAAQAISYEGAGTVEFIVDGARMTPDSFYFMEMNTRLQVEHPVSEMVTGVDLVSWQLRVAAGERLPLEQDAISISGHAFEARLYAEDAGHDFLPQTGRIAHYAMPDRARVDSGVEAGSAVTPYYDPMLAKIIVSGANRDEALSAFCTALRGVTVVGCVTNRDFLLALAGHADFARGAVDTGLIGRDLAALLADGPARAPYRDLAMLAAFGAPLALEDGPPDSGLERRLGAWQLWGEPSLPVTLSEDGATVTGLVSRLDETRYRCQSGERDRVYDIRRGQALPSLQYYPSVLSDGRAILVRAIVSSGQITIDMNFYARSFGDMSEHVDAPGDDVASNRIIAPMPGLVTVANAVPGALVAKGDVLFVMEAMKMEHSLTAPVGGRIAELSASTGDQVEKGAILVVIEAE
ncbi:MAG: acetyl/propionyl/methylcrotonyl-CoA carboxylase subunit alpha [Rhizobiales bacterium]|nr:acetyl/propionyl/methylcrotonyl-CoA carboxylase subunit alpha [Hyphomicrobiales bacterium]